MISTRSRRLSAALAVGAIFAVGGCSKLGSPVDRAVEDAGANSLMHAGATIHAAGDPVRAISYYQEALQLSVNDPAILLALAHALSDAGDHEGAIIAFDRAIDAGADDADTLRGIGNALMAINRPEIALPKLQQAVIMQPSPAGFNSLGVAYDALGQAEIAQKSYREGLALTPSHIGLANNLALSLALSGNTGQAIEILEELVMEPGSSAANRQSLALAYGLSGDYVRAEEIGREDLDEQSVIMNISYYRTLEAMEDHARKVAILGILRSNRTPNAVGSVDPR